MNDPIPMIPLFEGKPVAAAKLRVMSAGSLDIADRVMRVDDIVYVLVEARVSQVHHNVNERTGDLERLQTARVLSVEVVDANALTNNLAAVRHG